MSHLHRQLAANLAIAADKDSEHPATPVIPKAPRAPKAASAPKAKSRGKK